MSAVEVNVSGGKEHAGQPWVWRLSRDFNVTVVIKKANVDTDFGWMTLELQGADEDIQRATAWLMTTGLHIEAMTRSLGVT